ncbi:hypothetical protein [Longirhabdus pacifica]|uniref:hypothetical protein n=1 Tax=Longirhabdus pacifica TaxID=2305227 RepID=UPI001008F467|nr:hypothetical protein [Longirhabdus pacifica]
MNLADMLSYSDIDQLSQIATQYNCRCSSNSKRELIQAILIAFSRKDQFEDLVKNLTLEESHFMQLLLFEKKKKYSLEELMARANYSVMDNKDEPENRGKGQSRKKISKFKQLGFLFNGVSHQTKYEFQVPTDLKQKIFAVMYKQFKSHMQYVKPPQIYRDESSLITDDIFKFLTFVQEEEIPITPEGFMYKRSLQHILSQMSVAEQPVDKGEWRFGYGRRFKMYPNRFSFIYDYCITSKLCQEKDGFIQLTEEGTERVAKRLKEKNMQVYHLYIKLYKAPIRNILALVAWIQNLAENWIAVEPLKEVLLPYVKPYFYDNQHDILEKRVLKMMLHLGIITVSEDEEVGTCIKTTHIGKQLMNQVTITDFDTIMRIDTS